MTRPLRDGWHVKWRQIRLEGSKCMMLKSVKAAANHCEFGRTNLMSSQKLKHIYRIIAICRSSAQAIYKQSVSLRSSSQKRRRKSRKVACTYQEADVSIKSLCVSASRSHVIGMQAAVLGAGSHIRLRLAFAAVHSTKMHSQSFIGQTHPQLHRGYVGRSRRRHEYRVYARFRRSGDEEGRSAEVGTSSFYNANALRSRIIDMWHYTHMSNHGGPNSLLDHRREGRVEMLHL